MGRIRVLALGLAALVAAVVALPHGQGGEKEKDKGKEPARKMSAACKTITNVAAAYQMAEFGRDNKVPEALIAAAQVIGTANSKKGKLTDKCKVAKALEPDENKEALALLDEAVKMAGDSAAIKTLAMEARTRINEKERSPVGGSRYWSGYFRGDGIDVADTYFLRLRGGEITTVSLNGIGDPGLDLDLELIDDETNSIVAADRRVSPNAFIRYDVPRNGDYRIRVINYTGNIRCDRYTLRAE